MSALCLHAASAKRQNRQILAPLTATFTAGHLTAIIGPNGAGKSTLLELAAGLLPPASGHVTLNGEDLARIPRQALARRRAYLPQRAGVDWPLTVERVVTLGLTPVLPAFGPLPPQHRLQLDETLAAFDLLALRHRPVTTLSGGELARVMLARACVSDPELLIVDEPTAGLDPRHAIDALHRLHVRARAGCIVLLAIHDIDLALRFADQVVALRDGQMLRTLPATDVDAPLLEALYGMKVQLARDAHGPFVRFEGRGLCPWTPPGSGDPGPIP